MVNKDYEKWWVQYKEVNRLDPGTRFRKRLICDDVMAHDGLEVLDLGCGAGELLGEIEKKCPDKWLYGADVSREALKLLAGFVNIKESWLVDLERKVALLKKFDVIICSEVIEHVENWQMVIKSLERLSKKESKIILTTQSGKLYPHHKKVGHVKHFELKELVDELVSRGFKIVEARRVGWPFMNLKNILVTFFLKDSNYESGKINWVTKFALSLFYYLYLFSLKSYGPQIYIVALKN